VLNPSTTTAIAVILSCCALNFETMRLDTDYKIMQHQSIMNALIEQEEMNLVRTLNPKIFIDGNKWCVLYGENVQDGICGFGHTPRKAIYDFNKAFNESLP